MREWCLKTNTRFHFSEWDPEVLDCHIQEAVYDTEEGNVRLKMSPYLVSLDQWLIEHLVLIETICRRKCPCSSLGVVSLLCGNFCPRLTSV